MKISRIAQLGAVAAIAALALAGCASNEAGGTTAPPTATHPPSPARSPAPARPRSRSPSRRGPPGSRPPTPTSPSTTTPPGSGTGRESFQAGAVQFAGSDRAFKVEEIEAGPFDALRRGLGHRRAPRLRLADRDRRSTSRASTRSTSTPPPSRASSPARSPTGTTRRSPRLNDGVTLPDLAITPVHRSDDSGTTANFTDYLAQTARRRLDLRARSSEWPLQGGEAAQGTSGVVYAVKGGNGTIGYADHSQTAEGLDAVDVQVGESGSSRPPRAPRRDLDASPLEEGRAATDLAFAIDRTTDEAGAYPVVLVSYMIALRGVRRRRRRAAREGLLRVRASQRGGQQAAAAAAGSAPISDDAAPSRSQAAIDLISHRVRHPAPARRSAPGRGRRPTRPPRPERTT